MSVILREVEDPGPFYIVTIFGIRVKKLIVNLQERSYPIYIGEDILSKDLVRPYVAGHQVLIVSNSEVASIYLKQIKHIFRKFQVDEVIIPEGEIFKTLETTHLIYDCLINNKHLRSTTLVALGGGVVGDITGFVAACYQRGVNFIQIPTTLLAQVDASVGGKTGVNHPLGKNMIGAFHQPKAVFIDLCTLDTLPEREYLSGLAEVVKAALIQDREFFCWLEQHIPQLLIRERNALSHVIEQACAIKIKIVVADERDTNVRALLNYGHTFAHALEQITGYEQWLHGEAVAVGMVLAAQYAESIGWLDNKAVSRIKNILTMMKLPIRLPNSIAVMQMIACMGSDKKKDIVGIRLVLLKDIGQAVLSQQIDHHTLEKILTSNQSHG